jgi:hypothetical protein
LRDAGVPINLIVAAVWLVLTLAGYRLATRGRLFAAASVAGA